MLRGWGIEHVWWQVLALAAFGALFLTIAAARIERQRARPTKKAKRAAGP